MIEAARACQLRVPQDLAVIGFDDIPAAKLITPRLTTIHQPMAEEGRLAVKTLLKKDGRLQIVVPTKLIIRESSDPTILGSAEEKEIEVRAHPTPEGSKRKERRCKEPANSTAQGRRANR